MANEFDDDDFESGFDDFDTGKSDGGGFSLKELIADKPAVKIGIVLVAVFLVVGGVFALTGSGKNQDEISNVTNAPVTGAVLSPDDELTPEYQRAIEETDRLKAEAALRGGEDSAVPTVTFGEQDRILSDLEGELENEQDPFSKWRIEEFDRRVEEQKEEIQREQDEFVEAFDDAVSLQPDPAAVTALSDAMLAQMQAILEAQQIPPVDIITVTQAQTINDAKRVAGGDLNDSDLLAQASTNDLTSNKIAQADREIVIPAGTIIYAQLLTEANTDVNGPILAQVLDGPFVGGRIIGGFNQAFRKVTMQFSRLTLKNKSYSINAVAVDPDTNLGGLASEYNPRFFQRAVLPAAARFIEGLGSGIAQNTETTVSSGVSTTTSNADLDIEQELGRGLEEGAREFGRVLQQEGNRVQPLVRVYAGTPIGLFFTDDVYKDGLSGQPTPPAVSNIDPNLSQGIPGAQPFNQSSQPGFGAQQIPSTQQINQFLNQ